MSEQINVVVNKNKALFYGREDDFKEFLLKYFEKIFNEHPLKNLDRFDASERIKTAGFHKDLSAWRNIYKNIVVSSCLEVSGKPKRFDYKFYFIEEKLDADTIAIIDEALEEVGRLKRDFKFSQALEKVEELLNLIKDRDDRVFNLKLYDEKRDIFKAEKVYKRNSARLIELEKIMKENIAEDNLDEIIENGDEIIQVTKDLRKGPLMRKYSKIVEESKSERKLRRDFARLEQYIAQNRERRNYIAVVIDCWKLIKLATDNHKDELINKYTQILKEVDEEVDKIIYNIEKAIKESEALIEDYQFEEALTKINAELELLDIIQFKGDKDYEERLQAKRNECIDAQEMELKLVEDISDLDSKLKQRIKDNKIFSAKNYCERLIILSEENKRPELVEEYTQIMNQLDNKIEDLKSSIDDVIEESIKLSEIFQFEEALAHISIMLKFIGQNLPIYRQKLEDTRNIISKLENNYRLIEQEINELNTTLGDLLVKGNYLAALDICNQIFKIHEEQNDEKSMESTSFILNQITSKIEEIKSNIEILIEESYQLSKDYLFKEAFSKITSGRELIGRQNLQDDKRKLLKREDQILEEQEAYIKFIEDIPKLETELNEALRDKQFVIALNKCDLLIYIYEALNQPEVIKKYNEIYDDINEEINKVKEEVDEVINNSDKLSANFEFEKAISSINDLLKKLKEQFFPDYTKKLEFKRQEIITLETQYKDFLNQIGELDRELEKYLKKENYIVAINICEDIIHLSEFNKNEEYVKKYKNKLKEIKKEFRELSKVKSSWTKGITKVKSSLGKGATIVKSSVTKGVSKITTPIEKKFKKERISERVITKEKGPVRIKAKSRTSCIRTGSSYYPYIRWTPIRRLMKDAGAEIVACNAVIELIEWLGTAVETLTKTALNLTEHANRKKISKDSILMAMKYRK